VHATVAKGWLQRVVKLQGMIAGIIAAAAVERRLTQMRPDAVILIGWHLCSDGGREATRLHTDPENRGTVPLAGAYLLLPCTHTPMALR
jgi:hypothetical protein